MPPIEILASIESPLASSRSELPWDMADIAFDAIDRSRIASDEVLFFVVASASLIESGSDLYTELLCEHFADDVELVDWLTLHWQHEELQHGMALRAYVAQAWPDFDWQRTFTQFMAEYSLYCSLSQLEQSPALELAARCIVETGTASLYRALHDYTDEPVLKQLTGYIRADEVRHYKNFYRNFVAHRAGEANSRWQILRTVARRVAEINDEDADCALRHVFKVVYPHAAIDSAHFHRLSSAARQLVARNVSQSMMVKMALKPLQLPGRVQHYIAKPVAKIMQYMFSGA